jgi:uncharacterized protein (DUF2252 family)
MGEDRNNPLTEQFLRPRNIRRAMGKRLRKVVPRSSHGQWSPAENRQNPLDLLKSQDEGRLAHLLPIKYGRMAASPFAFLRGSAVVMAADLASTPVIGQDVVLCGDAHIANFGLFASPERNLVFDINDFDECYIGPWEWDLKRLAASIVVAGKQNGFGNELTREQAKQAIEVYRWAMRRFSKMPVLDLWYYHVGARDVQKLFAEKASNRSRKEIRKTIARAVSRTQGRTLEKLTHTQDGQRQINYEPPLLVPIREFDYSDALEAFGIKQDLDKKTIQALYKAWSEYLDTLTVDRRLLLERFSMQDIALRVGGVGSVGSRCFILFLEGSGEDEGLILQLKEVGSSVLEAYLPPLEHELKARRVVMGQRLIQATSDPFLGYHRSPISGHEYYWRQLKDMKGSIDVANLDRSGFETYIALCAACLARAHARTGDPAVIAGYLGNGNVFDQAVTEFAAVYADQTEKDHAALLQAIKDGRIEAQGGI